MFKARLLPICLATFACSNGDTRTVSGRLDTSQFALMKDGAEVVAAAVSGRTHRAPIRSDGTFTMELLVGERYQLRFANLTDSEGVYDAFAVLAVDGGTRRTFQVMAGPAFDLGRIGRVGTVTSSLRAFTGGHDDEDDDEEDDGDTEDTDDDTEDADSTDGDSDSTDEDSDSNDADSDQDDDDVDQVCDEEGGMEMEDVEAENDPADGMCACSDDSDSDSDDGTDTDDGDSDSDTDSDTDSDGSDDDSDDDEDSCGSDDHDDDLDDECEEPAPPDGGENNPPVPCTTNEDCAGGVCTEGVCVGV